MNIRRNVGRIAVGALAGTALLAGVLAPAALADDANVVVTGGSLAITTAPTAGDFTGVTLDGTAKTTTASLDNFQVNDARGSGAGWNVTVQATQFAADLTLSIPASAYAKTYRSDLTVTLASTP